MSASRSRTLDRSKSRRGVKGNKKEETGFLDHKRIQNTITIHKMIMQNWALSQTRNSRGVGPGDDLVCTKLRGSWKTVSSQAGTACQCLAGNPLNKVSHCKPSLNRNSVNLRSCQYSKSPNDYFIDTTSKQPIVLISILGFSLQQQNVCPFLPLFNIFFPSIRLTGQNHAQVDFEPGLADAAPAVQSPMRRGRVK
jgi:hypothetical protein